MPSILDHLIVIAFAVVYPVYGCWTFPAFRRDVAQRGGAARIAGYRLTIVIQWLLLAAAVAAWAYSERPWADAGIAAPAVNWRFGLGLGLALLYLVIAAWQTRQISRQPEMQEKLRRQFDSVADFLPHTRVEGRWFNTLSVTAGVCEETLYRGILIWYLATWLGLYGGTTIAVVIFGLAHLYQGPRGAFRVVIAGAIFAGLYLLTESLWVSMLVHVTIDIQVGLMSRIVLGNVEE